MANKARFRSLSRRSDFLSLKSNGRSIHVNSWLIVNLQRTELDEIRCGWTISRQIGSAVIRNRLRRWGKEYLRRWAAQGRGGLDLNVIFRRRDRSFYSELSHEDFDKVMEKLVRRLERFSE
ncbi:MAG: ribonuclease P protein component [Bdellovibrionales bacterium]